MILAITKCIALSSGAWLSNDNSCVKATEITVASTKCSAYSSGASHFVEISLNFIKYRMKTEKYADALMVMTDTKS